MDHQRFDDLTRRLATGRSRRDALTMLAGGALGGLLGLAGVREAAAACRLVRQTCDAGRRCCAGAKCANGRCKCKEASGFFACNGPNTRCVNTNTSAQHCGACDQACDPAQNELCSNGFCVDHCADTLRNGGETDLNCGGPDCPPCAKGQTCDFDRDCEGDLICDPEDDTCQDSRSCDDGIKNGRETDIDCGGPGCGGCADGLKCFLNDDCLNNFCDRSADPNEAGVCGLKPTCVNGKKDGTESDVDCGGADCPRCEFGKKCNSVDDCRGLAFCVNRAGDGSDKKFCVECTTGAAVSADEICQALYGDERPKCVNYTCRALDGTCTADKDLCKVGLSGSQCSCGKCRITTGGAPVCINTNQGDILCQKNPCTSNTLCVNRFGPGAVCVKNTGGICSCNSCAIPC